MYDQCVCVCMYVSICAVKEKRQLILEELMGIWEWLEGGDMEAFWGGKTRENDVYIL